MNSEIQITPENNVIRNVESRNVSHNYVQKRIREKEWIFFVLNKIVKNSINQSSFLFNDAKEKTILIDFINTLFCAQVT